MMIFKMLAVCVLIGLVMVWCGHGDDQRRARAEDESKDRSATIAARRFVEAHLKSPGSARWQENEDRVVHEDGKFVVRGVVDSQNGFGAILRSESVCGMYDHYGNWVLEGLTIMPQGTSEAPIVVKGDPSEIARVKASRQELKDAASGRSRSKTN